MTESSSKPAPYRVSYSRHVREELRSLVSRANQRGLGPQVLAAVRTIDERLRIYPQFGQPLYDLKLEPAQLWIATVPPVVVKYVFDEERRQVMIVAPFEQLPRSGL
jgi:hypothetical protein